MSQWTHVRGGLELVSRPYEKKTPKKPLVEPKREDFETEEAYDEAYTKYDYEWRKLYYYPYPKEQFKVSMPRPRNSYDWKNKKPGGPTLEFTAYAYSLPRARKYIDEAFKLFPQGELGIRYSVDQTIRDSTSSSSDFDYPCDVKAYQNALTEMYKSEDFFHNYTFEELHKYFDVSNHCWVEHINHILVGVRDDIRYCSALDFQEGLEKFLDYLEEHDISVEDGYLEWEDEYDPDHIYAWRKSRLHYDFHYQIVKLDRKTNTIVHAKTWIIREDEDGMWLRDENGKFIYDVIETDGPYIEKESKEE